MVINVLYFKDRTKYATLGDTIQHKKNFTPLLWSTGICSNGTLDQQSQFTSGAKISELKLEFYMGYTFKCLSKVLVNRVHMVILSTFLVIRYLLEVAEQRIYNLIIITLSYTFEILHNKDIGL